MRAKNIDRIFLFTWSSPISLSTTLTLCLLLLFLLQTSCGQGNHGTTIGKSQLLTNPGVPTIQQKKVIKTIEDQVDNLEKNGNPINKDQLEAGTYSLGTVSSSIKIEGTMGTLFTSVANNYLAGDAGNAKAVLDPRDDSNHSGSTGAYTDQPRVVDIPQKFARTGNGSWTPDPSDQSTVMRSLTTQLQSDGKVVQKLGDVQNVQAAVFKILAAPDRTDSEGGTPAYYGHDEKRITIAVRLMKTSGVSAPGARNATSPGSSGLRIWVTFDERPVGGKTRTGKTSGTGVFRNVFLDYNFKPADSPGAAGGTNGPAQGSTTISDKAGGTTGAAGTGTGTGDPPANNTQPGNKSNAATGATDGPNAGSSAEPPSPAASSEQTGGGVDAGGGRSGSGEAGAGGAQQLPLPASSPNGAGGEDAAGGATSSGSAAGSAGGSSGTN